MTVALTDSEERRRFARACRYCQRERRRPQRHARGGFRRGQGWPSQRIVHLIKPTAVSRERPTYPSTSPRAVKRWTSPSHPVTGGVCCCVRAADRFCSLCPSPVTRAAILTLGAGDCAHRDSPFALSTTGGPCAGTESLVVFLFSGLLLRHCIHSVSAPDTVAPLDLYTLEATLADSPENARDARGMIDRIPT